MSNQRTIQRAQPTPHDRQAAQHDIRYFAEHPGVFAYTCPATDGERKQYDQPPGTHVRVFRIGPTLHARAFIPINVRVN